MAPSPSRRHWRQPAYSSPPLPSPWGFYPILDLDRLFEEASAYPDRACARAAELAAGLSAMGVPVLQLRAKRLAAGAFLAAARQVVAAAPNAAVVINDRADLARLSCAAGVHLGQTDLPPASVRPLLGPGTVLGFSTHSAAQARAALPNPGGQPSYLALGPVFATSSKRNPDPVVGVEEIIRVRTFYSGPLVAIGGITLDRCPSVWAAGADAVAVIGGWLDDPQPLARARQYMLAFEAFCRQSGGS